ncbi:MAG: hypothetical protein C4326_12600 [Ignavibacteria bacterium]
MHRISGSVRRGAAVVVSFVFLTLVTFGQPSLSPSKVFVEGEDLIYNVRYGFVDLGQVRIKTLKRITVSSSPAYQTIAYIDSYKKIPFVDLHAVFESIIDTGMFSHYFLGKSKDGQYWSFGRYRYDYPTKRVLLEFGGRDTIVEHRDTLALEEKTQDGLSLFFYAREHLFSRRRHRIPAIVKERKVYTDIDFDGKRRAVEQDFIEYPVDVVGFEGTLEFTGIFGLTGDFEGWFSNDEARVPIVAKMKVILGSVTIELMKWTRPGWSPPRARE